MTSVRQDSVTHSMVAKDNRIDMYNSKGGGEEVAGGLSRRE